jgi:hypothetical protein
LDFTLAMFVVGMTILLSAILIGVMVFSS